MRFDQSQNERGHAAALPDGEAGRCTREPKRSVATGVGDLQRFGVERFEQRPFRVTVAADFRRLGPTIRFSRRRGTPSLFQAFVAGAADLVSLG